MDEIIRMFTDPVKAIEFGYRLKAQFDTNKAYRRAKELEWLEDIRQVKGIYDPTVKIAEGNSRVYPKITRSKINIVLSRLHEMLFPENDRNWEAIPTPEPSISEETVVEIARSLLTEDENGEPIFPDEDEINLAIKKYAKETCEKMVSVMDDQFTEMDYSEETKKVLRSGLTYGTGVMKGVLIRNKTKRKWKPVDNGDYEEATDNEDVPFFEFVRLWDWYPDMSVTDLDTMDGSFERHIMTKHDLRELMKRDDFYPGIIRKHLEEHPSGDYVAENWEIDLQVIDVQAGADKTSAGFQTNNDDDKRSANRQTGKKYQVLEYWGYVDGSDLEACGVTVDDISLEYAANVWLLGGKPIKVALYYGVLDKYKVFYYEKDETSIYGEGLARVMRHSQISISAGSRMLLDNAACVTGDTVVYRNQSTQYATSENGRSACITVKELWDKKGAFKSGLKRNKIRCVDEKTGEIYYNRITDVFNNGIRPVFEVTTEHGYKIKATDDHRFLCDTGHWQELSIFCVGDDIAVNGQPKKKNGRCIECGRPTTMIGVRCRSCASKMHNSKWNTQQAMIAADSTDASKSTARQRWACQKDKKDYCERCGIDIETGVRLGIHHIDRNPYNNAPENKMTLCQQCHMFIHHRYDYFGQPFQHRYVDYDKISSIEYIGEEEVFDLEMLAPDHNFIANGFVAHNCTAGPQVEVNMSLLAPDTDVDSIYARKIWFREGRGIEAQYPAIRGLEFNSHIDELLTVIDTFKGFADEETCLPTWMIGERINNETAQAASGRMATITIAIKDVVKNFDAFTEGIIQDLYAWNMDFNPRQDIKGDYMCKARGVSSLVMKEIRMQALNQLSTTMTEEDWIYVDRREFLNEKFKAHDINITLRSEEEADKIRTANQESIQMQLAIQMQQAEVGYKKAQTMAQLSKARENNVDAVVKSQGEDTQLVDAQTDKVRVETELLLKPEKEKKKKDVKQSKKV